jgi:nonsense-mediated mRNA decay protein 3
MWISNSIDITEGIPKQSSSFLSESTKSQSIANVCMLASVSFCRNCERFLSPPQVWMLAKPESSELLSICLKKLKGLNKVRLTEAHFIWTEPHSKRLRVSMTIQKEVRFNLTLSRLPGNRWTHSGPNQHRPRANV